MVFLLWASIACLLLVVSDSFTSVPRFVHNSLDQKNRDPSRSSIVGSAEQRRFCTILRAGQKSAEELKQEAEKLRSEARKLRESIPETPSPTPSVENGVQAEETLDDDSEKVSYRLYIDIGREEGTWMDPRWGASGRRIEFTVDVGFHTNTPAPPEVIDKMVKDNFGGKSSAVNVLASADTARLRGGFDSMKCHGGGYRIDLGKNGLTVRFVLDVDGTPEVGSTYGDVSIPKGCLYFSLPCFGNVSNLSSKEGIVTVRKMGWNTGWRREESRIVGIFRAKPLEDAKKRDKY